MFKNKKRDQSGFTLIELLVVISIIGLLSSIVLVALNSAKDKARIASGKVFGDSLYQNFGANAAVMYNFDEGSGNTSKDMSANNIPLTFSSSPSPTWVSGINGFALSFPNSAMYAETNNSNSLVPLTNGTMSSWTLATWVQLLNTSNYGFILSMDNVFIRNNAGTIDLSFNYGYGNATGITNATINKWYFVAATYSSNTKIATIYVDGKQINSVSISNPLLSTSMLGIGNYNFGGGYPCYCTVDEVRVYTETLLAAQIQNLYALGAAEHGIALK